MAKSKAQDAAAAAEELKAQEQSGLATADPQEPAEQAKEPVVEGTQEPAEVTEPVAEDAAPEAEQAQEPAVVTESADEEQASEAEETASEELVLVSNAAKSSLRQPSSGWEIEPGKSRKLLNDGWLENQLNAKLLVLV